MAPCNTAASAVAIEEGCFAPSTAAGRAREDGAMRILVTGGAGFVGSHLVERLLRDGHAVRVLDDFSTGRRDNLAFAGAHEPLEIVEGDIRDAGTVCSAMRNVDGVFHEAALVSVPRSVEAPELSCDINAHGTARVLDAARAAGVRRVVFASSSCVACPLPSATPSGFAFGM